MIPSNRLSSVALYADFYPPDDIDPPNSLTDYEIGGQALNDPSAGLRDRVWTVVADEAGVVRLSAPSVFETAIFTAPGITEISLTFDQNMRPFFAFVQNGQAKFRWYDTVLGANRITDLSPADRWPKVSIDDKRQSATEQGMSDVILAYVRDGQLYFRQQRDRFEVERHLDGTAAGFPVVPGRLLRVGMNRENRLQFMFEG
jgi:hypothetical protein